MGRAEHLEQWWHQHFRYESEMWREPTPTESVEFWIRTGQCTTPTVSRQCLATPPHNLSEGLTDARAHVDVLLRQRARLEGVVKPARVRTHERAEDVGGCLTARDGVVRDANPAHRREREVKPDVLERVVFELLQLVF